MQYDDLPGTGLNLIWMSLIQYDEKDCDKAVKRDRKLRLGTEQLCERWKKSRQTMNIWLRLTRKLLRSTISQSPRHIEEAEESRRNWSSKSILIPVSVQRSMRKVFWFCKYILVKQVILTSCCVCNTDTELFREQWYHDVVRHHTETIKINPQDPRVSPVLILLCVSLLFLPFSV